MRLIDAEDLRNEVDTWGCNDYDKYDFLDAIDNAPTVKDISLEIAQKSIELGRKVGQLEGKLERPHGECEKCDFRKFSEKFVDGVVELMNKNGITSFEQLSEILKGGAE